MNLYLVLWIVGLSYAVEHGWMEIFEKPLKPFSCGVCLSLWLGISTALILHNYLYAFIPYLCARLVSKYLWA